VETDIKVIGLKLRFTWCYKCFEAFFDWSISKILSSDSIKCFFVALSEGTLCLKYTRVRTQSSFNRDAKNRTERRIKRNRKVKKKNENSLGCIGFPPAAAIDPCKSIMNYRWYANLLSLHFSPLLSITLHYEIACNKVARRCTAIIANSLSDRCPARSGLFRWSFWRVSLEESRPRERRYAVIKGQSTPRLIDLLSSPLLQYETPVRCRFIRIPLWF